MVHALALMGVVFRRSGWWSALKRMLVPAIVVVVAICADAASASDLGIAKSFFPGDATANVEEASGAPPSALVRAGDGRVLRYAFSTRDVSGSVGYSGRPLDVVAAMTPDRPDKHRWRHDEGAQRPRQPDLSTGESAQHPLARVGHAAIR